MSQALILPQYPGDFSLSGHTHSQYLTSHQSLSSYATKTYVDNAVAGIDTSTVPSHTHNYAASNHTHSYASTSHTHSYASSTHTHKCGYFNTHPWYCPLKTNSYTVQFEGEFEGAGRYWTNIIAIPFLTASSTSAHSSLASGNAVVSLSNNIFNSSHLSQTIYFTKDGTTYSGTVTCTNTFNTARAAITITLPALCAGPAILFLGVGLAETGNWTKKPNDD